MLNITEKIIIVSVLFSEFPESSETALGKDEECDTSQCTNSLGLFDQPKTNIFTVVLVLL